MLKYNIRSSCLKMGTSANLQPLHVGFTSDKGGNTIDVHWYTRKSVLHHVSFRHCQFEISKPAAAIHQSNVFHNRSGMTT